MGDPEDEPAEVLHMTVNCAIPLISKQPRKKSPECHESLIQWESLHEAAHCLKLSRKFARCSRKAAEVELKALPVYPSRDAKQPLLNAARIQRPQNMQHPDHGQAIGTAGGHATERRRTTTPLLT